MIVGTSRQKRALYIIGSSASFSLNRHWAELLETLKASASLGTTFPLQCPRHRQKLLQVPGSYDFPADGCGESCGELLACGHTCALPCHGPDLPHGRCKVRITHKFEKCLHEAKLQCHELTESGPKCRQQLSVKLSCGHPRLIFCCEYTAKTEKKEAIACIESLTHKLACAHSISLLCGTATDGYFEEDDNVTACPSCLMHLLGVPFKDMDLKRAHPPAKIAQLKLKGAFERGSAFETDAYANILQLTIVAEGVCRGSLCGSEWSPLLTQLLTRCRLPQALLDMVTPSDSIWDAGLDERTRLLELRALGERLRLLAVLLRETGHRLPRTWAGNAFGMLAGVAVSPRSGDTSGALRRVSCGGACGCSAGENLGVF
jgi:hypothetical protein